jgi:hypothetical protein
MVKTTYVTGFINLPRLEENQSRRQLDTYLRVCQDLLKLDIHLVYFGDPEIGARVAEERAVLGLADATAVIPMTYEELPYYAHQEEITRVVNADGIFGGSEPNRYTPAYVVTILSKVPLLLRAAEKNPFGSSHFCWIDFGYFHLKEAYPHAFYGIDASLFEDIDNLWTDTHFKIQIITPPDDIFQISEETLLLADRHVFAGGIFGGSVPTLEWIAAEQERRAVAALAKGFIANEEMILTAIFRAHPERFDINAAYYATILQNFGVARMSLTRIMPALHILHANEKRAHVASICWKLLVGYHRRHIDVGADELGRVCRWYLEVVDDAKRPYVRKMCEFYSVNVNGVGADEAVGLKPWVYNNGFDSLYHDIRKVTGPHCLADLIEAADRTPDCVAFTSTGWLKYAVETPLRYSAGYAPGHGIYTVCGGDGSTPPTSAPPLP